MQPPVLLFSAVLVFSFYFYLYTGNSVPSHIFHHKKKQLAVNHFYQRQDGDLTRSAAKRAE